MDEQESTSGSPEPPASTEPHVSYGRSSAPQPHILTRDELNDLVRDLELSKSKSELPGSRQTMESSREKCPNFFVSQSSLAAGAFFRKEDDLVFCYDIDGPMNALGIKHDQQEWQLFIDSSKLSLNPSIPVGHRTRCPHERNLRKPKAATE